MFDPSDPARSTPEERAQEIASILATGYLRLRAMGLSAAPTPPITGGYSHGENLPSGPQNGLDNSPEQSVYGERVNAGERGPERRRA
jgi:hypothetical protein